MQGCVRAASGVGMSSQCRWRGGGPGGGGDRSARSMGKEAGGSPFTCPRGLAQWPPTQRVLTRPFPPPPPALTPHPRLQHVSSHATLFQIRPLNRLAAIQFAVLKVIKLGDHVPVESPHGTMLITWRPRSELSHFGNPRRHRPLGHIKLYLGNQRTRARAAFILANICYIRISFSDHKLVLLNERTTDERFLLRIFLRYNVNVYHSL